MPKNRLHPHCYRLFELATCLIYEANEQALSIVFVVVPVVQPVASLRFPLSLQSPLDRASCDTALPTDRQDDHRDFHTTASTRKCPLLSASDHCGLVSSLDTPRSNLSVFPDHLDLDHHNMVVIQPVSADRLLESFCLPLHFLPPGHRQSNCSPCNQLQQSLALSARALLPASVFCGCFIFLVEHLCGRLSAGLGRKCLCLLFRGVQWIWIAERLPG